jgi:hypothetical protein
MSLSSPREKPQTHFAVQVLQATKSMPEKPLSYVTPPQFHTFTQMSSYCTRLTFAALNIFGMRTKTHVGIHVVFVLLPDLNKIWNTLTDFHNDIHVACYMRTDTRMKIQTGVANHIGAYWHLFVAIRQTNAGTSNPRRQRC